MKRATDRRTDRLGIVVENHPYDRGYWSRFDGEPRPKRSGLARQGWDACDKELAKRRRYEEDDQ